MTRILPVLVCMLFLAFACTNQNNAVQNNTDKTTAQTSCRGNTPTTTVFNYSEQELRVKGLSRKKYGGVQNAEAVLAPGQSSVEAELCHVEYMKVNKPQEWLLIWHTSETNENKWMDIELRPDVWMSVDDDIVVYCMSGEDPLLGDWYDVWCNSGLVLSSPVVNFISNLPTPSPTPALTPTSTPTWNQLLETAKQIPYDELLRDPKSYEDEIVYFQAKVEQARKYKMAGKHNSVFIFIASVTPIDHNRWEDKVHLTFYNAPENILEGDVVQFVGVLEEVTTYEFPDKQLITMPTITILQLTVE